MRGIALGVLAVASWGCAPPAPHPFDSPTVFVGSLRSETLFPKRQLVGCETFAGEESATLTGAAGSTDNPICVANSCGFGEAEFEVEKVFSGSPGLGRGVLRYSLGEWCEPEFRLTREPVLITIDEYDRESGEHQFSFDAVFESEKGDFILPQAIAQIRGVQLASLLKPLPSTVDYGAEEDFTDSEIEDLLALGFVVTDEGRVAAHQGVFLADLAQALSGREGRD